MGVSKWVHVEHCDILRETDKAFLVKVPDGEEHWIPKSQVSDPDVLEAGDEDVTVTMSEWIVGEKGIEVD